MGQIIALARKELMLWAQKPGSWIIVFVVPFLFIWIMQAVFGSSGTPTVTVFAVNQDGGSEAEQVMNALQNSPNLAIEELDSRSEAERRVGSGERMAAIIVPLDFERSLTTSLGAKIEIIIDPARSEQANIVIGLVNSALGSIMVDAEVSRGVENSVDQVLKSVETGNQPATGEGGPGPAPAPVNTETLREFFTAAMKGVVSNQVQTALEDPLVKLNVEAYQPENQAVEEIRPPSLLDYLVPGYSLMFVFFLIPNLALAVVEERQTGTLRRLLVAPLPRSRILLGKMLPYLLIAVVQLTFVLLMSKFLFGIDLGNSWIGLAIIIFTSALAMASLGILIAAFAQTEGQANGLAIVIILAMAVISGAMFPGIQIPGLQVLTPHYWSMQGFLNIIARGMGAQGAFLPTGVLLTLSAVFFTIGAIRFRFE